MALLWRKQIICSCLIILFTFLMLILITVLLKGPVFLPEYYQAARYFTIRPVTVRSYPGPFNILRVYAGGIPGLFLCN